MRDIPKTARVAVVVALLVSSGLAQAKPDVIKPSTAKKVVAVKKTPEQVAAEAKRVLALDLMNRCHALSLELTDLQRVNLLNPLILGAGWIGDKGLAKQWAREMFELAPNLEPKLGVAVQLRAITALSNSDADEALSMLQRLDLASMVGLPWQYSGEDGIQYSSVRVLVGFVQKKGKAGMPRVLEVASTLGEGGRYPYVAVMKAAHALNDPKIEESTAKLLLTRFQQRIDPPSAAFEFAEMLSNSADYWPPELLKVSVQAAVDGIVIFPPDGFDTSSGQSIRLLSDGGLMKDPITSAIMQLRPLMDRVDPKWEQRLVETYATASRPKVATASANQNTMQFSPFQDAGLSDEQREAAANRYVEIAGTDPEKALAAVNAISDPKLRTDAAAAIVDYLVHNKPEEAAKFVVIEERSAAATEDMLRKFQALCAKLRMDAINQRHAAVREELESAFRMADKLLRKTKEDGGETWEITRYLEEAVGATIKLEPDLTIAQIDTVYLPNDRATLFVAAATSLVEPKESPKE